MNFMDLISKYMASQGGVSQNDQNMLRQAGGLFDLFRQYTTPQMPPPSAATPSVPAMQQPAPAPMSQASPQVNFWQQPSSVLPTQQPMPQMQTPPTPMQPQQPPPMPMQPQPQQQMPMPMPMPMSPKPSAPSMPASSVSGLLNTIKDRIVAIKPETSAPSQQYVPKPVALSPSGALNDIRNATTATPIKPPPATSKPATPVKSLSSYAGSVTSSKKPVQRFAAGGLVLDDEEDKADGIIPAATEDDYMSDLLAKYMSPESEYAAEIAAARGKASSQQENFDNLIKQAMANKSEGPSKSELYFNLAAAFGTPGKTGNFFEQAGGAAKVLADNRRAQRETGAANRNQALQLGLENAKLGLSTAKEDLTTLRTLAGQEQGTKRQLILEELKARRAAQQPSSEAGKVARDAGLKPGTPEYTKFVREYSDKKIGSANAYKEAMIDIAKQGVGLRQRQVGATERSTDLAVEQAKKLTPAELKMKDEAQDAMDSARNAYASLRQALELSKNAFSGSLVDQGKRAALGAVGSADPKLAATEQLESLLRRVDLDSLRATFGGNPTEGERAALTALSGLAAATPDSRNKLIEQAMKAMMRGYEQRKQRLEQITSGKYRITEPSAAAAQEPQYGDLPEETDLTMEDLGAP